MQAMQSVHHQSIQRSTVLWLWVLIPSQTRRGGSCCFCGGSVSSFCKPSDQQGLPQSKRRRRGRSRRRVTTRKVTLIGYQQHAVYSTGDRTVAVIFFLIFMVVVIGAVVRSGSYRGKTPARTS